MPRIDLDAIESICGSGYPAPFGDAAGDRRIRRLSKPGGITDFEVNHVILPEGAWSSQRHWHEGEDEFLVMIQGQATLIDDAGETPLAAGDCIAFPKGDGVGHHLIGAAGGCTFVVWGVPELTDCHYPDIDLHLNAAGGHFTRKDGSYY